MFNAIVSEVPGTPRRTAAPAGDWATLPGASGSIESARTAQGALSSLVADIPLSSTDPIGVGLPGEAELRGLLQAWDATAAASPQPSLAPVDAPAFYFLDDIVSGPFRAVPSAGYAQPLQADMAAVSDPAADDQRWRESGQDLLAHGRGTSASMNLPVFGSGDGQLNLARASAPFDVNLIRRDFPILQQRVNGRSLVWLDNAATTQKPRAVLDHLRHFYEHESSDVHRAAHEIAARAGDVYEAARERVRAFLGASSSHEIAFVRGATEAINMVAQSWGRQHIAKDDEIVISWLEHHANIVPWQRLAAETGARLRVIPVDDTGQILLGEYGQLLGPKTRIVSFAHVSHALGTITPARQMIEMAHAAGARVLLDGAQAVSRTRVDVQELNPDWYVFSGHKVFAPTGIGALYGKDGLLGETERRHRGSMITDVTFERTLYQDAPSRFTPGTSNIAGAVGLGAAIDYITAIGIDAIDQYEQQLLAYATRRLTGIPGLRVIGTASEKAGVLSFVMDGQTPDDIRAALSREGIAVRSGHHCAQPILRRFGVEATVRASLALYNTFADIDALVAVVARLATSRSTRWPHARPTSLDNVAPRG